MTEANTGLRVIVSNTPRSPKHVVFARPRGKRCLRCLASMQIAGTNVVGVILTAFESFDKQHARCVPE